jgi:hypothetical protein
VHVCIRCESRIDCNSFPSFEISMVKLRWPRDQTLRVQRGWRSWASVWWRQVSSDLLCPIYFIIHQSAYHDQSKDWLALHFTLSLITFWVTMVSFMLLLYFNQCTWCEHLWYDVVIMIMMLDWWYFKGTRAVSRVPLRKDWFVGWPPRKTVQPWGWYGTPLAN